MSASLHAHLSRENPVSAELVASDKARTIRAMNQLYRVKKTSNGTVLHGGLQRSDAERLARIEAAKFGWEPGYPEPEHFGIEIEPEKFDLGAANQKLQTLLNDPGLSMNEKRRIAQPIIAEADKERSKLEADLTHLHESSEELRLQLAALQELQPWSEKPPLLRLERNDCSRLHKLKEAALSGRIIDGDKKDETGVKDGAKYIAAIEHTFVVKHDWASAFANAPDAAGEFCLPYTQCAFEFRLDGRSIILWAQELEGQQSFTCFLEVHGYWYCPPEADAKDEFMRYLWDQVRAICIALDAEVATHTVVRASAALNEKRAKVGKPLLANYRVVDLARRHRIANPASSGETGRKVRMHFRRGHWRHYDDRRTWIKWMLVGNPDLGFIQKHYAL